MWRQTRIRLVLVLLLLFTGRTTLAREVLTRAECVVAADEVIDGTLFALCQNLTISGVVNGDVIGAAVRTKIDGRVNGNVYMLAGQLDIAGRVSKDIHFAGAVLRLHPPAGDDETAASERLRLNGGVKALALSTTIFENTLVDDDIIAVGYQLVVRGDIGGEINFWGSALELAGHVERDVYSTVGNPQADSSTLETLMIPFNFDMQLRNPGLTIAGSGGIAGSLSYAGPVRGDIRGVVAGAIDFTVVSQTILPTLEEPGSVNLYIIQFGREFTTLLAIGAAALLTVPQGLQAPLRNLRTRPFASFSVGMLAFLLSFPVVLIAVVLSVIVLMLVGLIGPHGLEVAVGIVLALVNLGGASVFYFMAIFVARALVGLALGRFLLRMLRIQREKLLWQVASLALGVLVLSAVVSLPVIGLLVNAAALFMGLGAILSVILEQFRRWRDTNPAAAGYAPAPAFARQHPGMATLPRALPDAVVPTLPAPMPPDVEEPGTYQGPGMDNLPDGFDFGFFE